MLKYYSLSSNIEPEATCQWRPGARATGSQRHGHPGRDSDGHASGTDTVTASGQWQWWHSLPLALTASGRLPLAARLRLAA